jgi:hypothetical protein
MIRGLPSFRVMHMLTTVIAIVVLLGLAVGASAYFTSHGAGTAGASVGSINPAASVTTRQTGADVTISWSAATLSSGGSVQGYRVKRSDNTTICGSPTPVTSLSCTDASVPSGTYTYTVTAVYNSFTASATSSSITILTTPSIAAEPSNPSASSAPSFSFSGGGGSGYQCQLDGGGFSTCTGPQSYSLADGSHTFKVHAIQGSSTGPDTSYTWTIDTSAPSIGAKPSNPSANASPSFSFSHTQVAYTFKCRLDGGGFSACTTPKLYGGLTDGSHTFQVEGVSADGATTTVASYTWLLDTTAPSGGSVTYTNGYLTSASVSVTLTQGTDSGSGVNAGSGILQRSTGTLSNGGCTGFGSFSTIATNPSLSYTDSVVTDGHCYKYQYLVSDNAGNQATYTSTSVAKVDTTAPSGGAVAVNGVAATSGGSTSATASTSFTITGRTDYADAGSGLASSTLTVQSEALTSGACGSPGSGGKYTSPTIISGTTNPTIEAGFCYLYKLTGTDNAGNTASISTTVKVASSPTISSPSKGSPAVIEHSKEATVSITGANFASGVTALLADSADFKLEGGVTFNSSTSLTIHVKSIGGAKKKSNLTLTNPDGGSVTCTECLSVP